MQFPWNKPEDPELLAFWREKHEREQDEKAARNTEQRQKRTRRELIDSYRMLLRLHVAVALGCLVIAGYAFDSRTLAGFLKVTAVGVVIAGASLLLGFLLGFIFCIPRAAKPSRDTEKDTGSTPHETQQQKRDPFDDNSNLVDISDWLTKILVGAGLVELNHIPDALWRLSVALSPGMQGCDSESCVASSKAFCLSILLFYFAAGFLIGYLWTRLYYQKALSDLKNQNVRVEGEKEFLKNLDEATYERGVGNTGKAMAIINRLMAVDPKNGRLLFEKGRTLRKMALESTPPDKSKLQEALDFMKKAMQALPGLAPPLYNVACYQNLLGMDPLEVLTNLEKAFNIDPNLKSVALNDQDLATLRTNEKFQALTGTLKP